MISKIGVDIVENARMKDLMENEAFLNRILAPEELRVLKDIESVKRRIEYCAGRFASKEALIKALPEGIHNLSYKEICVCNDVNGSPYILCDKVTVKVHLSISHTDLVTIAFVITEK